MPDADILEPSAAQSQGFEAIHAELLQFFPELVEELGGDPAGLCAEAGVDRRAFSGEVEATYRQLFRLLELAATRLSCPDFGLRLATRQGGYGSFGPLGPVMRHSKTFGDALTYVATHNYAHSLAARVRIEPLPADEAVFVAHDVLLDGSEPRGQAVEQIMLLGHLGARELTGGLARARLVQFRHQPAMPLAAYRRHFGCGVRFGCDLDGVYFSDRDLACPIVDPDADAYRLATDYIDTAFTLQEPPLRVQVRGIIRQLLGSGDCSNHRVAAQLGMHTRTLHRRLSADGTSFQRIKDEVRRDMMLFELRQGRLGLARISEKLGFAEQSVMTRRSQRWFAAPPSRLRHQTVDPVGIGQARPADRR